MSATVALLGGNGFGTLYTGAMLRSMMQTVGVVEASVGEADALWVSICDPDDLPVLLQARRVACGRPVVMGGFEGYFSRPYLAWADAVVVGEGWEFIQAWGEDPARALSLACVSTRDHLASESSTHIPWELCPLVRVPGRERYYYLAGRGCRGRCAFCATAAVRPYENAPDALVRKALRYVEQRRGKLTLITNDSYRVHLSSAVNAQSVRVRDYLRNPRRYKASMLHFGVEAWSENQRRLWHKPISDEDIVRLLETTARYRQPCELFFIVGYSGWSLADVEAFGAILPCDASNSPAVRVKCTYLDPCPHTELESLPINTVFCDTREVFSILNSRNKRIRVYPTRSMARSAWRSVLHRCSPAEALRLGPQPRDTNTADSLATFTRRLAQAGLDSKLT